MLLSTEELLRQIQFQHEKQYALIDRKNRDYAGTGPFENFTATAEAAGISTDRAFLFHLVNKITRAKTLLMKKPDVANEPLEDTLMDMANYVNLWLAYRSTLSE